MPSKLMRLSFPEEASDVYNLIKSKKSPSKFVVDCVRFYQKNKTQKFNEKSSENLELVVSKLVREEINKSQSSLTPLITKILKEELSKVDVVSRKDKLFDLDVSIDTPKVSFGQPDLNSLDFNANVSFKGALDLFDDD